MKDVIRDLSTVSLPLNVRDLRYEPGSWAAPHHVALLAPPLPDIQRRGRNLQSMP